MEQPGLPEHLAALLLAQVDQQAAKAECQKQYVRADHVHRHGKSAVGQEKGIHRNIACQRFKKRAYAVAM